MHLFFKRRADRLCCDGAPPDPPARLHRGRASPAGSLLLDSASKEVSRAERSVVKLRDAEGLLREAADLYQAAGDLSRLRAAEANLSKVRAPTTSDGYT
eukprot:1183722-Prorocentrum_minimum.AAC.1